MTTFNKFILRIALTTVPNPLRHTTHSVCLLAWLGFLFLPAMLSTSRAAHACAQIPGTQANMAYVPSHIYLDTDGTAYDVTNTYVQTGSYYDTQKGYVVYTGYVTGADGSSIDITVDLNDGNVDDWGGRRIGFVCGPNDPD